MPSAYGRTHHRFEVRGAFADKAKTQTQIVDSLDRQPNSHGCHGAAAAAVLGRWYHIFITDHARELQSLIVLIVTHRARKHSQMRAGPTGHSGLDATVP